ncbi:MAG: hypothetical protein HYY59_03000 [Candidatus Omnitrophica bacterium]|nr:hypothetical protein [Candidatus Omnitrophota bacterium]
MKRVRIAALVGLGVCAACLGAGELLAFSASYDQAITQGAETWTFKVIIRDERFRVEAGVGDEREIAIRNQDGIYQYIPKEGIAVKLPMLDALVKPLDGLSDYPGYLNARQAERLPPETVGGHPCDVYRFVDADAHETTTVWVWSEKQFPVRLEIDGANGKRVVELTNIRLGITVDGFAFELPSGIKLIDLAGGATRDALAETRQP